MRLTPKSVAAVAIPLAAALSLVSAVFAASLIERRVTTEIRHALVMEGITWADLRADGLLVHMSGTAPNEASRFRALTVTGTIIDAARVIDEMEVTPARPVVAPDFSLELLRNEAGVSIIGLIPAGHQREAIAAAAAEAAQGAPVTDMMDSARFPEPEGWPAALDFGLEALRLLPRAKISVNASKVVVTAISDSAAAKRELESKLAERAPPGLEVLIDISAPRPVITPFTLRFVIGPEGARFDACSADTAEARERILAAAREAGLGDEASCTIGLGVPSPDWASAVETGIAALARLGGGALTISDADISLVALDTAPQALFDRVVGELEADLPEVFALHSVLPEPVKVDGTGEGDGPPEFVATKSPEGLVQLRGRVTDTLGRSAAESYARARFGLENVYAAMRLDEELPEGWPIRVLTALEGLAELKHGSVVVQPDFVELRGVTGDAEARARIAQRFADKLGDSQNFGIELRYEEVPEPLTTLPSPEECVATIDGILEEQKITFEPGAATLKGESLRVVGRIADVLRDCPDVPIEIGGHTDDQGREEMNQHLSQERAEAVLDALIARRILTTNLTAKGYGESVPIADNGTEEGREANRRIEFTLILPEEDGPETDAAAGLPDTAADAGAAADAPQETETAETEADQQDEQN